jgi:hypothetical protein
MDSVLDYHIVLSTPYLRGYLKGAVRGWWWERVEK